MSYVSIGIMRAGKTLELGRASLNPEGVFGITYFAPGHTDTNDSFGVKFLRTFYGRRSNNTIEDLGSLAKQMSYPCAQF
ncbi:hypothetical protein [Paenibacillus eucommiae]|uniref:Uncharacterized protein n=1 Tax=Paenibacillus eucommiae TaxID=1355755 RepID=A0ABS4J2C6_9BACL|nr:hypothetical protein [Paenibacillus eucommiae]MBP1993406.1 hypothetical protein [Paenibacillus eucommiae]